MAAARTLWFIDRVEQGMEVPLCRYRPWYRQKVAPSQLDVMWACREALQEAGIFPIPRFTRIWPKIMSLNMLYLLQRRARN